MLSTLLAPQPFKRMWEENRRSHRLPAEIRSAVNEPRKPAVSSILFATNFSSSSRCAFEVAKQLARETNRRLVVLHVLSGEATTQRTQSTDVWESRLRSLYPHDSSVEVEYVAAEGNVCEEILSRAHAKDCDLVVAGVREERRLARLLSGEVAAQLRLHCPRPLLNMSIPPLGRSQASTATVSNRRWPRTILHAADFSMPGMYALEVARSLARQSSSRLVVVHYIPVRPGTKEWRDRAARVRQLLAPLNAELRLRVELFEEDPVNRLLDLERETQADLIVVGTQGGTGMNRLLQNVVARDLSRRAASPVLAIKLPAESAEYSLMPAVNATESSTFSASETLPFT